MITSTFLETRVDASLADVPTTQKANQREGRRRSGKPAAQPCDDRVFRSVAGNKVSNWTLEADRKTQETFS